ncbi:unnamed protein product [Malus fusca]
MTRRYWNINLEEMMEAGVHFGHGTRKWNPRMAPYISAKRKGIHIINLTRTARFLSEACDLKNIRLFENVSLWEFQRFGNMNVLLCSIKTLKGLYDISGVEVGQHFYWQIGRALLPWKIIQLPHGELAAPTNDINTTVALALLTSVAYFYAGLTKKGLGYFVPSVVPIPVMFLGLFTSGIQALIFATLAAAYIGESMEGHH